MTIATRRKIYWVLFSLALSAFAAGLAFSLPILAGETDSSFLSPSGALFEGRILGFRFASASGALSGALLSGFVATALLAGVLAVFRKTSSAEIFFFSFWALSLALECGRVAVFRLAAGTATDASIEYASRVVLAGRYIGSLALFASGLFAVGLRSEQPGSFAVALVAIGGAFAVAVPLDTGVYLGTLVLRPGYPWIDVALAALAAVVTLANYLRAAAVTGERGYVQAGLGLLVAVIGRQVLESAWNPLLILPGAALVGFGSWILIRRLHAYYLWQ